MFIGFNRDFKSAEQTYSFSSCFGQVRFVPPAAYNESGTHRFDKRPPTFHQVGVCTTIDISINGSAIQIIHPSPHTGYHEYEHSRSDAFSLIKQIAFVSLPIDGLSKPTALSPTASLMLSSRSRKRHQRWVPRYSPFTGDINITEAGPSMSLWLLQTD
jgi:hypothetical protein